MRPFVKTKIIIIRIVDKCIVSAIRYRRMGIPTKKACRIIKINFQQNIKN